MTTPIISDLKKGCSIEIDRFNSGVIGSYTIDRICKRHIVVSNSQGKWAMPLNRIKDIITIV